MSVITVTIERNGEKKKDAIYTKNINNNYINIFSDVDKRIYCHNDINGFSIAAGIGLKKSDSGLSVMSSRDWVNTLKQFKKPQYGHYVICYVYKCKCKIFTDEAGVRQLYYHKNKNKVVISTLLSEITEKINGLEPDWESIGSLLYNQFIVGNTTELHNVKRLLPREEMTIDIHDLSYDLSKRNIKRISENSKKIFISEVSRICNIENKIPFLALSGGVDSRIILSFLLKNKKEFECYTVGNRKNYDRKMAVYLCRKFGIKNTIIDTNIKTKLSDIKELLTYNGVSTILERATPYCIINKMFTHNDIIINGNFGEFYKRNYKFRTNLLLYGNLENYMRYAYKLPSIFNKEISQQLKDGAKNELKEVLKSVNL